MKILLQNVRFSPGEEEWLDLMVNVMKVDPVVAQNQIINYKREQLFRAEHDGQTLMAEQLRYELGLTNDRPDYNDSASVKAPEIYVPK